MRSLVSTVRAFAALLVVLSFAGLLAFAQSPSSLEGVAVQQFQDMQRLKSVVEILAPKLQVPLVAEVETQPMTPFPAISYLIVADNERVVHIYGGHLLVWAVHARLDQADYIDFAARATFGRFIKGLSPKAWSLKLKEIGFVTGKLPVNFPDE